MRLPRPICHIAAWIIAAVVINTASARAAPDFDKLSPAQLDALPAKDAADYFLRKDKDSAQSSLAFDFIAGAALQKLLFPVGTFRNGTYSALATGIAEFQGTLGHKATGILTFSELKELMSRAGQYQMTRVSLPPGDPTISHDENNAVVSGTWEIVGDQIATPLNFSDISCIRGIGMCIDANANIYIDGSTYRLRSDVTYYNVTSWTDEAVVAESAAICRVNTITLSLSANQVYMITRDRAKECYVGAGVPSLPPLSVPRTSRLVDGFEKSQTFLDRQEKAAALFLAPAVQAWVAAVNRKPHTQR